jgi:hypothetical protein
MIPLTGQDGKPIDNQQPAPVEDQLNAIGAEGWELLKYDVVMLPPKGKQIIGGGPPQPRPCLHCMFKREKDTISEVRMPPGSIFSGK